ncbi:MAG: sigma-70 family RNA polymerase sigma factor [Lachnospiraceae bacterium]|nr:sigma-70 family RNA polymerase sigma factor [Lachnospiraceae bacterium]
MTNEQLAASIQTGEYPSGNMLLLYEQMKGFIFHHAKNYQGYAEYADLLQEGFLALYDAVAGYDPEKGSFSTYAGWWIKNRLRRYVFGDNAAIRVPEHMHARIMEYKRFVENFSQKHDREPSDQEAMRALDLSGRQLEEIKRACCLITISSLDRPILEDGNKAISLLDSIADEHNNIEAAEERIYLEERSRAVWAAVDSLDPDHAEVIRERYAEGMTLTEIANCRGCSFQNVRSMEHQALRRLRTGKLRKMLKPFAEDLIYSMGLRSGGVGQFNRTLTSSTEWAVLTMEERREREWQLFMEKELEQYKIMGYET